MAGNLRPQAIEKESKLPTEASSSALCEIS